MRSAGRAFGTPARGQPPSRTPGGSSSLFDRYGADSSGFGRPTSAGGTATSRLRERGLKLTCYLNGEANRTAANFTGNVPNISTIIGGVSCRPARRASGSTRSSACPSQKCSVLKNRRVTP